ncbi:MAG: hypothetical protein OJF61_002436 [Rhodanobacteraceae bacterium]|jgi:multidrug transporter EmrE-like cation transporter|nr:MAG: hypothetical protein OJF61_002436 [Rhodanobacteraceae bacterium]
MNGAALPPGDDAPAAHATAARTGSLSPLLLAWVALLAVETLGQVSLKFAGTRVGALQPNLHSILAALSTPWLWLGLACYLGQFVLWMRILEKSHLSRAFPTSAIAFVAIMVASWAVFGDPMGWEKILGSAIIVAGILLLGSDAQHTPPVPPRHDAEGNPP